MSNDDHNPRRPAGSPEGGQFSAKPAEGEAETSHLDPHSKNHADEYRHALASLGVRPAALSRLSNEDTFEVMESFDFPHTGAVDVTNPAEVRATVAGFICGRDETRFDHRLTLDSARTIAEEASTSADAAVQYVRDQDERLITAQQGESTDELVSAFLETCHSLTDMVDARGHAHRAYWDMQVMEVGRGPAKSLMHPSEPEEVRTGIAGALRRMEDPNYRGQTGI